MFPFRQVSRFIRATIRRLKPRRQHKPVEAPAKKPAGQRPPQMVEGLEGRGMI